MKHFLLIVFISSINWDCYAQIYQLYEPIEEGKLTDWNPTEINEYEGIYGFGESEGSYSLFVFVATNKVFGQIRYEYWWFDEDSTFMGPRKEYINLGQLDIKNGEFESNGIHGKFVKYKKYADCVILFEPWKFVPTGAEGDLGQWGGELKVWHYGKYSQASLELLNEEDLSELSITELRIMRNEIFARYGYQFRNGGKMENYFKQQSWYNPVSYPITEELLTDIERTNIKLIKMVESGR